MVLNLFGPESLKNMLPEVEKTTNNNLNRWSRQKSVEMKEATTKVSSLNCRVISEMVTQLSCILLHTNSQIH